MPDYSKSVIYIIKPNVNNYDENDVYYGSTTNFIKRCKQHESSYISFKNDNNYSKYISYFYIYDIYGIDNCITEIIENYSCETKDELLIREKYYINNYLCVNKYLPITTKDEKKEYQIEYYNKNNEDILNKKKQYYIDNIDKIKEYREKNKEIIKENDKNRQSNYRKNNKEEIAKSKKKYQNEHKDEISKYQKEYQEQNKEKLTKQKKEYYENNKQELLDYKKQKILCKTCNCYIGIHDKLKHERTTKHIINFINY
jgi:hypothetical protein